MAAVLRGNVDRVISNRSVTIRSERPNLTMAKISPVPELEFLKLSVNHAELANKLLKLGFPAPDPSEYRAHHRAPLRT